MSLNLQDVREHLTHFDFTKLFIEDLGWFVPGSVPVVPFTVDGTQGEGRPLAQLGGVVAFRITVAGGGIPDPKTRAAIDNEIGKQFHEHLAIFVDQAQNPTQSLWYWVKRAGAKRYPREHLYMQGQPGDLFVGKLSSMFVDISELDEQGNLSVVEAARRVREALDVERVTREFYTRFKDQRVAFYELIQGIDDDRDRQWYVSVLLNRLMFVYFLQRKGFLDNSDLRYLQNKLAQYQGGEDGRYYDEFLRTLFFRGFALPQNGRSAAEATLLGQIPYLNGGLFLVHLVEQRWPAIRIPDVAFANLFTLFERFSWNLDDTPGGQDDELNPDVLGYIFEKYINQKAFGAYYTRTEITEYLCEHTIHRLILDQVNTPAIPGVSAGRQFATVADLLMNLDADLCRTLLSETLPKMSLLDPACGSGAFLVAAMKTLIPIYSAIIGRIEFLGNAYLRQWLAGIRAEHPSIQYYIKKRIISDNLFGVDLMEEATEIARLRLFLALVTAVQTVDQLEPLPNIDFNILAGNSLIGLLHVDEAAFNSRDQQLNMFQKPYHTLVAEKNRMVQDYREAAARLQDADAGLQGLRDSIQNQRNEASATLNELLLDEFSKQLGIRYEQATWDAAKQQEGRPIKRALTIADIQALHPFHWGYEFDQVLNERGGFDAIITNPPWEIFKPNGKEFFAEHSNLITKKKMRIEDFEAEQARLLQDVEVRAAWLVYESQYPYVSEYFRTASQYKNQIAVVNGRKVGTDVNLYKLFVEQCFNLLRNGGRCGMIVQSSIYTDLGAKQLREMLFSQGQLDVLFGLSNEKYIFEGVHHAQKLAILVFEKGGQTEVLTAAFRINTREAVAPGDLEYFLNANSEHLQIPVELVRRLSPDSLSVMEFKSAMDAQIAEKMLRFPLLGEKIPDHWNLALTREFDMTNDSRLFMTAAAPGRLPLYEGKLIHQFTHQWGEPRYWVDEKAGRAAVLGRRPDTSQRLDYQTYRLGFRDIASNTNERTMISTIIPSAFHGNKIPTVRVFDETGNPVITYAEQLYLAGVWNSFVIDAFLRMKVTTTLNFFYIYQLPVPRLTEKDTAFRPIVERAAKLICTTPEFDALAQAVGLTGHQDGVTDPQERASLRAELDGMIAHLYGLTETEFAHILGAFPLVEQAVKDAALAAYRAFTPHPDTAQIAALIAAGEGDRVEFKAAARCNPYTKQADDKLKDPIVQEVAAFLNGREGGALLIGVRDDGTVAGLADDYATVSPAKPGRDTYELFLRNTLAGNLTTASGGNVGTLDLYTISFHPVQGQDVCRIGIAPAPEPIYADGDFYVRSGNQKRKLKPQEAIAYIKQRWG